MALETGYGEKVYSPDLKVFDLDDKSTILNIIASIVVGPVRLLLRVSHNIMILPANLLGTYASGLLFVGITMAVLGIIDWLVFKHWPLIVSQVPVIACAIHMKVKSRNALDLDDNKYEVEIDNSQVEAMCNNIYDELNLIIGKDDEP